MVSDEKQAVKVEAEDFIRTFENNSRLINEEGVVEVVISWYQSGCQSEFSARAAVVFFFDGYVLKPKFKDRFGDLIKDESLLCDIYNDEGINDELVGNIQPYVNMVQLFDDDDDDDDVINQLNARGLKRLATINEERFYSTLGTSETLVKRVLQHKPDIPPNHAKEFVAAVKPYLQDFQAIKTLDPDTLKYALEQFAATAEYEKDALLGDIAFLDACRDRPDILLKVKILLVQYLKSDDPEACGMLFQNVKALGSQDFIDAITGRMFLQLLRKGKITPQLATTHGLLLGERLAGQIDKFDESDMSALSNLGGKGKLPMISLIASLTAEGLFSRLSQSAVLFGDFIDYDLVNKKREAFTPEQQASFKAALLLHLTNDLFIEKFTTARFFRALVNLSNSSEPAEWNDKINTIIFPCLIQKIEKIQGDLLKVLIRNPDNKSKIQRYLTETVFTEERRSEILGKSDLKAIISQNPHLCEKFGIQPPVIGVGTNPNSHFAPPPSGSGYESLIPLAGPPRTSQLPW